MCITVYEVTLVKVSATVDIWGIKTDPVNIWPPNVTTAYPLVGVEKSTLALSLSISVIALGIR